MVSTTFISALSFFLSDAMLMRASALEENDRPLWVGYGRSRGADTGHRESLAATITCTFVRLLRSANGHPIIIDTRHVVGSKTVVWYPLRR